MLMLINQELFQQRLSLTSHRLSAWSEEAVQAGRDADYSELKLYGSTAIIPVSGPLTYRYDFWSWLTDGASYTGIMQKLKMAEASEQVSQILMVFDTPGGEVMGCRMAAEAIRNCKKTVNAYVDPEAASAGLWLASQCAKITSMKDGWIGSLGVQTVMVSMADYYKERGLDIKVLRSEISPKKNAGIPYEPMSEEAVAERQERVDRKGEMFLEAVASGRGKTREYALANFGQGAMLDAEDALKVGLIDAIGSIEDVLAKPSMSTMGKKKMTGSRLVW